LNAEQVTPATKLDIVAYLLKVNGFPSGNSTLSDGDVDNIQIVKRGTDAAAVANFSLVEVVGCLTLNQINKWVLTNSSEPEITKEENSTPAALTAAKAKRLGSQTFELVSVSPSLKPESHKSHKVDVRGLLYKDARYSEVNLTSLETVAASCVN
jgi:hypothetical protein